MTDTYAREIADAIRWAKRKKLDLSARAQTIPIDTIDTPWHSAPGIYECRYRMKWLKYQHELVSLFRSAPPWPEGLPVIIVAYGSAWITGLRNKYAVIDGNHRFQSAQHAGYRQVPALVVSGVTVDALIDYFRPGEDDLLDEGFPFDEVMDIYTETSQLVAQNAQREKAWDMTK